MDEKKLKQAIDKADVISFDIFDTLLFRMTERPEDVFELIGRKLGIDNFEQFRRKMQQEISEILVKKKEAPHADLNQIYDYIADKNHSRDWVEVRQLELQMELDVVFRNKEIYQLYKYAVEQKKRIIATSDMYLTADHLRNMLDKCGYTQIETIYSSADLHSTKYEKTIYPVIAGKEGVQGKQIFHIGDNKTADVENARESGWNAYWYDRKMDVNPKNPGLFNGVAAKYNSQSSFWNRLGADIAGELYINLYRWLSELKNKYDCTQICLLARDGYNLWKIFQNAGRTDAVYLEMSRRSLLLAGITELDDETMELLPPYAMGQTLAEILDYLGMPSDKMDYVSTGFYSLQDIIRTKDDQSRVKQLFKNNETEFLKVCETERTEAEKYFTRNGIFDRINLYFDCGWNGSSQYLLKRFYRAAGHDEMLHFAYFGILDTEKSRKQLSGEIFDTYLFGPGRHVKAAMRLAKSIVLPELFFGAPHPSVWHYQNGEAVYEQDQYQTYRENIAEGIEVYFKLVYPFVKKYGIVFSKKELFEVLQRLSNDPTVEEAVEIGNVENVDGFVRQKTLKKYIARLDMKTIRMNPYIEIYWEKGLIKRPDISVMVKVFVVVKELLTKIKRKVGK